MQRIVDSASDKAPLAFAAGAAVFCALLMFGLAFTANLIG